MRRQPRSHAFTSSLLAASLAASLGACDASAIPGSSDDTPVAADESALLAGGLRWDRSLILGWNDSFGGRVVDADGDGRDDFNVLHTAGPNRALGTISVTTSGGLVAKHVQPVDTLVDGASIAGPFSEAGDLTGDGRPDFLQWNSALGLRVVERRADGSLHGLPATPWGTRIGGWLLGKLDFERGTFDADGDGHNELLVTSAWGAAVFDVSASGALSMYNVAQRGNAWAGTGSFTAGASFLLAGHFWGIAQEQLLVRDESSLAIVHVQPMSDTPGNFTVIERAPFGEMQTGGWRIGSGDRVVGVGDFDGDGKDDFALASPWGVGILTGGDWFGGTTAFKTIAGLPWGTSVGGLPLTSVGSDSDQADDFDGDGRPDLLLRDTNDGRLVVLSYDPMAHALVLKAQLRAGQRAAGGWLYDGKAQIIGAIGRFAASNKASLVVRTDWGMGVLGLDASGFVTQAAAAFEITCGDNVCNGGETCASCAMDCGTCPIETCGNHICGAGETCGSCPADCGTCSPPVETCGNHVCGAGESCGNCPADCGTCSPPPPPPTCNNNFVCDGAETCSNCEHDCGTAYKVCAVCQEASLTVHYENMTLTACSLDVALTRAAASIICANPDPSARGAYPGACP